MSSLVYANDTSASYEGSSPLPQSARQVIVVTTTFYTDATNTRYKLTLQTIQEAKSKGIHICIVDASPDGLGIKDSFRELGAHVFSQNHKGMGPSRRQAFSEGLELSKALCGPGRRALLWIEPEKYDMLEYIDSTIRPILTDEVDVVVPFRTERSWASYPDHQRNSEGVGNTQFAALVGRNDLDVYFGPVACVDSQVGALVLTPDPIQEGAADTYVPQFIATRSLVRGVRVKGVHVDFQYPEIQKIEEESTLLGAMLAKRAEQLATIGRSHEVIYKGKQ